jgi:hypothetical protein
MSNTLHGIDVWVEPRLLLLNSLHVAGEPLLILDE